jgi:hypothetical protein
MAGAARWAAIAATAGEAGPRCGRCVRLVELSFPVLVCPMQGFTRALTHVVHGFASRAEVDRTASRVC